MSVLYFSQLPTLVIYVRILFWSIYLHFPSCFSFQPVLHDWCNKGCGMCYPVCGMMHIKEPLLLIDKSSLCGGNRFPLSLSEWSFTICLTPYNRKQNVLSASLNKTFPSFIIYVSVLYFSQLPTLFFYVCILFLSIYLHVPRLDWS